MASKNKTIKFKVVAYMDSLGNPCCAKNFETGEVCQFYRTQKFGTYETCIFGEANGKYPEGMKRRNNGVGSLIPLKNCPIWPEKTKQK